MDAARRGALRAGLGLILATALAWAFALAFPSRVEVRIARTPQGAIGRVGAAQLSLDLSPEERARAGRLGWYLAGPTDSLYFQAADATAPLSSLGRVVEALQWLRPAARWEFLPAPGAGGRPYQPAAWQPLYGAAGQPGPAAGEDPTSATTADGRLYATLVGGRVAAGLMLGLDAAHNGYAFIIRPERRSISWWRVIDGVPATQIKDDVYRPDMAEGLSTLAQETALALTGALALALVAGLLGLIGSALAGRRPPRAAGVTAGGRRRLVSLTAGAICFAAVLAAVAVCLGPLEGIPHVQDDVAYLWQAKVFALGRAWAPAPPQPDFFEQGFILITDGRWFSKYPPGWPLMLAPGVWAGLPWLINPLCAGLALAFVFATGRRLYGAAAGLVAAALGLASPFLLFMSGSYMSHPATMLCVAAALYCFVRLQQGGGLRPAVGAGFALGWAFISREATAVGVAAPFVVWAVCDLLAAGRASLRRPPGGGPLRARLARYGAMALGGVPPLVALGVVNQAQLGSPFRLAQELVGSYDQLGFGVGFGPEELGHSPALGLYNALVYLRTLDGALFGWPALFTLAPLILALVAAWRGPWRLARWDLFLLGGFLGLVAVYFAWWSATTIYGPRYWYEALPFLLLLSGRGITALGPAVGAAVGRTTDARIGAWAVGLPVGLLVVFNLAQSMPQQVAQHVGYNDVSASTLRRAEAAGLDHALVFVALDRGFIRRDFGKVFFADDPLLGGPIVYVRDLGADQNRALLPAFPDRRPYYLPLQGPPVAGVAP
jgi:Dolichyl-phosphate-mannose-protein mannosyltransferase